MKGERPVRDEWPSPGGLPVLGEVFVPSGWPVPGEGLVPGGRQGRTTGRSECFE